MEPSFILMSSKCEKMSSFCPLRIVDHKVSITAKRLEDCKWFHGKLTRHAACLRLTRDGQFLVRLARAREDLQLKLVLSLKWNGRHCHFQIRERCGYFSIEDLRFDRVVNLVDYYLRSKVPITRRIPAIIVEPVSRDDVTESAYIVEHMINIFIACVIVSIIYFCSLGSENSKS
ncbi:hypothetical protein AB6A40_003320 [Gnathostoma spinigerum]|uniref:SH2 domain-containing protein n=1 Tax=Gnathostoma spinigerum TaxID=75299 RepID=A0ABD6EAG0_9BILA